MRQVGIVKVRSKRRYRRGQYMLMYARGMRENPTKAEAAMLELLQQESRWHWLSQVTMEGAILDFYEPTARLCLEVDGGYHKTGRQRQNDTERDYRLMSVNVETIRVTNDDVLERPESTLGRIWTLYSDRIRRGKQRTPRADVSASEKQKIVRRLMRLSPARRRKLIQTLEDTGKHSWVLEALQHTEE